MRISPSYALWFHAWSEIGPGVSRATRRWFDDWTLSVAGGFSELHEDATMLKRTSAPAVTTVVVLARYLFTMVYS